MKRRLVVVGAGPIGIVAALGGAGRGFDVTVLERNAVGASLRRFGPTLFFSPFVMNLPKEARELLGSALPADEALLTGPGFADLLSLLARATPLAGRVLEKHRVVAIGRLGMTRGDYAGHPLRGERPFRLVVETPAGERCFEADAVLDASGAYDRPMALGAGGLPALGEAELGGRIIRDLGALDERRGSLSDKRVLLVGHGHSAANAIRALAEIAQSAPATRIVWAVRTLNLRPVVDVASDPLSERQSVVSQANDSAARPPGWLRVERRATVDSLARLNDGALEVLLSGDRRVMVDEILSLTGHRPDHSIASELAIEIHPATEGAARLSAALSGVTDCLAVPRVAPGDLASGEPGFYLVGAKSYGRARTFLLQTGYAQLDAILDHLARPE